VRVVHELTNTGTVPLTALSVADPSSHPVACPAGALAPGDSVVCTAALTLDQAQVDTGRLDAPATASGRSDHGNRHGRRPLERDAARRTGAGLRQGGASRRRRVLRRCGAGGDGAAREAASFCFTSVNLGNVTLAGAAVVDPALGLRPGAASARTAEGSPRLAPGARWVSTAETVAVEGFLNEASGTATAPDGAAVRSPTATARLDVEQPEASLRGVVWFDRNGDGVRGRGEWPLPRRDGHPQRRRTPPGRVSGSAADRTQVTGPDGEYAFTGLRPGPVRLRASVSLRGFAPTSDSDGSDDWVVDTDAVAGEPAGPTSRVWARVSCRAGSSRTTPAAAVPGAAVRCTWAGFDDVPGTADDVE
jgi:hypothetical protein